MYIVGISKTPCDCLGIEETQSLSGLYLDDTSHDRIPLSAAIWDCSDDGINEYFKRLILDSEQETKDNLRLSLDKYLRPRFTNMNFSIPTKKDWTSTKDPLNEFVYISIVPKNFSGNKIKIESIEVAGLGTNDFFILDSSGETIYQDSLENYQPITLTLDQVYYLGYHSDFPYRNYKFKCCGNEPIYQSIMQVGSGIGALEPCTTGLHPYGIKLQVSSYCDPFEFLSTLDFINNPFGRVYAKTVQLTARKNFAQWLITSGMDTNYLTTNEDDIRSLIQYYMAEIENRLMWMAQNYNFSNCYFCGGLSKSEIII